MAEAEDVIVDAARHATVFAQNLWRRYSPPSTAPAMVGLDEVMQRIELLLVAVFDRHYPIRPAQPPARPTLLSRLSRRDPSPRLAHAIPATDGVRIWLPRQAATDDRSEATAWYRTMALRQAMRAHRGSAEPIGQASTPLIRDIYLILEAYAADEALVALLPGVRSAIDTARRQALGSRPPLDAFAPSRQPLEKLLRSLLERRCGEPAATLPCPASPAASLALARRIAPTLIPGPAAERAAGLHPLLKDCWTGEFADADSRASPAGSPAEPTDTDQTAPARSARLERRPKRRDAAADEDDDNTPGPWMVHPEGGHESAEDPMGLQRPTDRDDQTSAEEFGDLLSELPEARLVSTPGRPKEILLSDDPPTDPASLILPAAPHQHAGAEQRIRYPEWDYRGGASGTAGAATGSGCYRHPGATVRLLPPLSGSQQWVDETLAQHRSLLHVIGRRFAMLRAEPQILRKRSDGEQVDLEAYLENHADFHAGLPRSDALYQTRRPARRNTAIMLLVDVSGSTDGWIAGNRRIIDVEREALLLVCMALDRLGDPYAVQAFSGEGAHGVTVREIKAFRQAFSNDTALGISALEPENYTRAGAAVRHATATLMRQSAAHRLLLLLSDGKPNDADGYEGRYGIEDTRQAVTEARLQGISPFCLTIDRSAADYLPRIFGANHYGLLPEPGLLPSVLLDWMNRLLRH